MIDYKLLEKKGGDLYESRKFFKEGQVIYIYIYIYMCVCTCARVCARPLYLFFISILYTYIFSFALKKKKTYGIRFYDSSLSLDEYINKFSV